MNNEMRKRAEKSAEYIERGYTHLEGLMSPEVANNMTYELQRLIAQVGSRLLAAPRIGSKPAYEVYGYNWWPMTTYHMALTNYAEALVGKPLLPTYCFFRSYQHGDICRIHADRAACEHSLSLTLAYADDIPWALSMENVPLEEERFFKSGQENDFGGESYSDVVMKPGDAVLYHGIERRHGRLLPNPNRWSAHMFLHWVEKDGAYSAEAYDGKKLPEHGDFIFPA